MQGMVVMAMKRVVLVAALMAMPLTLMAAEPGFYVTGSLGVANTSLDASDLPHAAGIISNSTNKLAYSLGMGYRFNTYAGAEAAYVNFGSPTYNLRRNDGVRSKMTIENEAYVMAVQGYIPLTPDVTLTGKVGMAFVHTDVNNQSSRAGSYHDKDNQVHPMFGFGGLYGLNENLSVKANIDFYPKLTKGGSDAADTDARMISVGLQYDF